jgi:NADPH-dependent 2,4-dienoyl-CoA reductase/sulfur reductase-like enzyme
MLPVTARAIHRLRTRQSGRQVRRLDLIILYQANTMKVIIVGAGIAGLAAGIGLRQGGHQVTVSDPARKLPDHQKPEKKHESLSLSLTLPS